MDKKQKLKSKSKIKKMTKVKYVDYCKDRGWKTVPIKVELAADEGKFLENGEQKMKKSLKCGWNMNDFSNQALINSRWSEFNMSEKSGKESQYNFFAVDTKCVGTLDIDCELPKNGNHLSEQFEHHPYVKSSTKSFGKHLLFDREDIPNLPKRTKQVLSKKWGNQIEFLNGQPGWYHMDTIIQYPERPLKLSKTFMKEFMTELSSKVVDLETKVNDLMAPVQVPGVAFSAFPPGFTYNVDDVAKNLMNYPVEKMAHYSNWGGIVTACASSQDMAVYKVLLKACRRPGAGFTSKRDVQDKWKQWSQHTDPKYAKSFMNKWSKPWIETDKRVLWEEIGCPELFIINTFKKTYGDEFICYDNKLSWYNSKTTLWKPDSGKEMIYSIIMSRLFSKVKMYWTNKLLDDEAFYKKKKEDGWSDDDLAPLEKEHAAHRKFVANMLQRLHQHTFVNNLTLTLINSLNTLMPRIQKNVQFNLDKSTTHLVQFLNGAFNLKTGKLVPRTREMYISLCLNYNYETKVKLVNSWKIKRILKKILPDSNLREAQLKWRGLCLTGETREQVFMLNLGTLASNGKSTLTKMFAEAFPIYYQSIGNDCFNKASGSAYNKCMAGLAGRPIRLIGMEEWGGDQQDTDKIKRTIDSSFITVKPLYQEEITIPIQFKIEANSNNNTVTESMDNGLNRRALLMEYNSVFVDNIEVVDEDKHIYLKDKSVTTLLNDDCMKLAFFQYIAPYAKEYYENGLNMSDEIKNGFAKMVEDDNELADFFAKFKPGYDCISKNEMLHLFSAFPQEMITKNVWRCLRQEFKKRGFLYDSYKQFTDSFSNKQVKGAFTGIRYIEDQEPDGDEDDELD